MVSTPEDLILALFSAAVSAADPAAAVARTIVCLELDLSVAGQTIHTPGRVVVAGVGKAAVAMARGLDLTCGRAISEGLLVTKDGHAGKRPARFTVREAAHPIPDERSVAAAKELLDLVGTCGESDVVIALISGGGSALIEAPRPSLALDDLGKTTDLLLRAGAPIEDLNAVRTPLSLVKGGGLRRAAPEAIFVSLLLSDVLSNDAHVIASGPTVLSTAPATRALEILSIYGLIDRVPSQVLSVLRVEKTAEMEPVAASADDVVVIVADNGAAVEAARAEAVAHEKSVKVVWFAKSGEAADLGRAWVQECVAVDQSVEVLLGGGEATVTVRGNGVGGRNTEFAAAACAELNRLGVHEWTIGSLATDGQDGTTEFAGAFGDRLTWRRALENGVDPEQALANNDTASIFAAAGGVVRTGPTGTNVNDLYIAVRRC
ncbi:MAG: glycerate kinase [Thermomicrobiales bacterium]